MSDIVLDVVVRENTGTGPAREARRQKQVPGVLYGGELGAVSIAMKQNEVLRALNSGNFLSNMIEISHEGEKQKVITKDVQFHPVTDMPVHVDFYRVNDDTIIDMEVSVQFTGDDVAPGIKRGGILNVVRYNVELKCPAGAIPDSITADISGMDIGDALHLSEVALPEGVTSSVDRDVTICTIVSSRASKQADGSEAEKGAEAEAAEAEGGEG